ncbi:Hypothetical predicted protein [Xyrichtys novacula]|uniref:Uncharacterized protein n=1 Tax=Xyrichtys novacula TaxID=13765 RepID=A0AAV1H8D1_XYRNO|nr:Hypothetical predicted protein [Xyrichtys novacula]
MGQVEAPVIGWRNRGEFEGCHRSRLSRTEVEPSSLEGEECSDNKGAATAATATAAPSQETTTLSPPRLCWSNLYATCWIRPPQITQMHN